MSGNESVKTTGEKRMEGMRATASTPGSRHPQLPPAPEGPAGRAALIALLRERSLLAALEALHARMGDIFRLPIHGFSPIVLAGPSSNRSLLTQARSRFRWRAPTDPITRLLGHGLLVEDGEEHDRLRLLISPALRRSAVGRYLPTIWSRTEQVCDRWRSGQWLDMLPQMRRVALLVLVDCLFGADLTPDLDRLWPHLLRTLKYISPGPWLVWPGVPRPGYARSLREVDRYLYRLVRARRTGGQPGDDILGLLVEEPGMSDRMVRDQLLTVLIAGHDTSTAHQSWAVHLLGSHPSAARRARQEVDEVLGSGHEPPSAAQLESMTYLGQVISEALRLYPPIHVGNRQAVEDVSFGGCRIPAGNRVMYSIYLAHRDTRFWIYPSQFNPERFSPQDRRAIEPYSYLPFGGGPRNCVGAAFAQLEARAVLAYLLRHFDWTPARKRVGMRMGATLEPKPGVIVRVRRREGLEG